MKKLVLSFAFLGFLAIPLLVRDGFLVYWMNGSYTSFPLLFIFFILFYVLDFIFGLFLEGIAHALSIAYSLSRKKQEMLFFLFEFFGSCLVIFSLDALFTFVNLSAAAKIVLISIHALLFLLIENFSAPKSEQADDIIPEIQLSVELQNEIRLLLKENDMISCISILQEKYPDIPFQHIVQAVRKIYYETKSS